MRAAEAYKHSFTKCVRSRVGDTVRFGQSSRLFILVGPEKLRPPEGLTRSAKKRLIELEAVNAAKQRDMEVCGTPCLAQPLHGAWNRPFLVSGTERTWCTNGDHGLCLAEDHGDKHSVA
jgi:hypothetical protein